MNEAVPLLVPELVKPPVMLKLIGYCVVPLTRLIEPLTVSGPPLTIDSAAIVNRLAVVAYANVCGTNGARTSKHGR